jgi:hypothetical protein
MCAGWRPQVNILRPDVRARACRNGGLATGSMQRRRRAKTVLARLKPLLNAPCFQGMEDEHRAAVAALLSKAYRVGKRDGYLSGWQSKPAVKAMRKPRAA